MAGAKKKPDPHLQMSRRKKRDRRIDADRLAEMIEEATVDAYGDAELATGWHAAIEDHLELPFDTEVLGVPVKVTELDVVGSRVIAVCTRGKDRQRIDLAELPLPTPPPGGAEWVQAYRHWAQGQC